MSSVADAGPYAEDGVRAQVRRWVGVLWGRLHAQYPRRLPATAPAVAFYRRGSTLGRAYLGDRGGASVAFHEGLLARCDGQTQLVETVAHELAHVAAFRIAGDRGHGAAWRDVMLRLGFEPQRTHALDVSDQPGVQRRWTYACGCTRHELTTTRHRRIQRGVRGYRCARCGEALRRSDPGSGGE